MDQKNSNLLPLGYLIGRTAKRIQQKLEHTFKQAGYEVTHEQWTVLNSLWRKDGLSQRTISRLTNKDETSLSRVLNTMVKHQLIIRIPCPTDRRIKQIFLTEQAKKIQAHLVQLTEALNNHLVSHLDEDEQLVFIQTLDKIYKIVK